MTAQESGPVLTEKREIDKMGKLLTQLTPEQRDRLEFGLRFGKMIFRCSDSNDFANPVEMDKRERS